jgi:hypothetical protein
MLRSLPMECKTYSTYCKSSQNDNNYLDARTLEAGIFMKLSKYVSDEEVKEVCRKLGIRDWSGLKDPEVTIREGKAILKVLGIRGMRIDPEQFRKGLEVELEHGTTLRDVNVTNNHPLLTGKIVIAHMKETLDYYKRLDVAELEGDLLKAFRRRDFKKATSVYKRLISARISLSQSESAEL